MDKKEKKGIHTSFAALPSALGALLVVGAVAFGGSVMRPMAEDLQAGQAPTAEPTAPAADADEAPIPEPEPKSAHKTDPSDHTADKWRNHEPKEKATQQPAEQKEQPTEAPKQEPTAKPQPVATAKPTTKPTAKPKQTSKPKPATGTLELWTGSHDGKTKLAWTAYEGEGFSYYKVVRSSDAEVSWPAGAGDQVIAAIGDRWATKVFDTDAPCSTKVFYRVFAVQSTDSGYHVLAASGVAHAVRECVEKTPRPDPVGMSLAAEQVEKGVQLTWSAFAGHGFKAYKVVRSTTNADPTYPLNDGSELIAAIGDMGVTSFVDKNVEAGTTYHYRVLAMGNDGSWYALGISTVATVTVS